MDKKNNIILVIAIILFIILTGFLFINKEDKPKEGNLEEITYNEVQKKVENQEDFVIVLSQTTCSHCADYKPILTTVAKKHNITIYYLDYNTYEENTANEIIKFFNFDGGTPTTFFFKDGKETSVMNRLSGAVSESKVIANLKKLEYIENE